MFLYSLPWTFMTPLMTELQTTAPPLWHCWGQYLTHNSLCAAAGMMGMQKECSREAHTGLNGDAACPGQCWRQARTLKGTVSPVDFWSSCSIQYQQLHQHQKYKCWEIMQTIYSATVTKQKQKTLTHQPKTAKIQKHHTSFSFFKMS